MVCKHLDRKYENSRKYYVLVMGLNKTVGNECDIKSGDVVDLVFTYFNGIDSKELLLNEAEKLGMKVYLGNPGLTYDVVVSFPFLEISQI